MISLDDAKIIKLQKGNENFEILVDVVLAKKYQEKLIKSKQVNINEYDFSELIASYDVYSDAKKGKIAKNLNKVFHNKSNEEIILEIIKNGKISYTKSEIKELHQNLLKKIVSYINLSTINSQTKLKIPTSRIEMLLNEIKFTPDLNKPIEKQIEEIIKKLRPMIPISISSKKLKIIVPAKNTKKIVSFIKSKYTHCKILKDCIDNEGNYFAEIEIFASQYIDFIKLIHQKSNNEIEIEDIN
jgi:ribosome maturation protein SDO1